MRKIVYLLIVIVSIIGIFVGVFFYARETVYPTDPWIIMRLNAGLYDDMWFISLRNYMPGYLISISLTVIFFTILISSTTRFFFKKPPSIDNYQEDYHIRDNRFFKNTKETE